MKRASRTFDFVDFDYDDSKRQRVVVKENQENKENEESKEKEDIDVDVRGDQVSNRLNGDETTRIYLENVLTMLDLVCGQIDQEQEEQDFDDDDDDVKIEKVIDPILKADKESVIISDSDETEEDDSQDIEDDDDDKDEYDGNAYLFDRIEWSTLLSIRCKCSKLSLGALVRLWRRQHRWIAVNQVKSKYNVADKCFDELRSLRLIEKSGAGDLRDVLATWPNHQLRQVANRCNVKLSSSSSPSSSSLSSSSSSSSTCLKSELIDLLVTRVGGQSSLSGWFAQRRRSSLLHDIVAEQCGGHCVRMAPKARHVLDRVQRLFTLSVPPPPPPPSSSMSSIEGSTLVDWMLVSSLRGLRFAGFESSGNFRHLFADRAALLRYERALDIESRLRDGATSSLPFERFDALLREAEAAMREHCATDTHARAMAAFSAGMARVADRGDAVKWRAAAAPLADVELVSLPLGCYTSSAGSVLARAVWHAVDYCERQRQYARACALLTSLLLALCYSPQRRGKWHDRLATNLAHLRRANASLAAAEAGLADTWTRMGPRIALQRRVARLARPPRRYKTPSFLSLSLRVAEQRRVEVTRAAPAKSDNASNVGQRVTYIGADGAPCSVEQVALEHYCRAPSSWQGVHSEGAVVRTLFGVLLFDQVFARSDVAFVTPMQAAPLDAGTRQFYIGRRAAIEQRLADVRGASKAALAAMARDAHARHAGTVCRFVADWQRFDIDQLAVAARCLGGTLLAGCFRVLAEGHTSARSGFPDLLLLDADAQRARFVEVKSPNDRLSDKQRAWIDALLSFGADVHLALVS
jgi:VRR-NUC domain/Fanconi-associated nuclease 1, TPR domain